MASPEGGGRHPLYRVWKSMKARCENPRSGAYKHYGARGIAVCERWRSPENFMADMLPSWSKGLTLERKDNNGGYSPGNVIFATRKAQANNRRSSKIIAHAGESMTISQWADKSGIPMKLLWARINLGWEFNRAITAPIRSRLA